MVTVTSFSCWGRGVAGDQALTRHRFASSRQPPNLRWRAQAATGQETVVLPTGRTTVGERTGRSGWDHRRRQIAVALEEERAAPEIGDAGEGRRAPAEDFKTSTGARLVGCQRAAQDGFRPDPLPLPWKPNSVDPPAGTLPL
ncbi:hypothetical protein GCM10017774_04830 [Lentzea cavernae]|uniref:Uncharacterized protein n=1 Tax=Lentzea cavernae TaxID=2020703 RepID=A0ABQ3LYU8_9PSEU|nr:hypothetical protein GCM10017774_04830 [Lentzea cavernae]